jgi:hypothetical protein
MKNTAYTIIALLVLVGGMAVAAQAQTGSRTQLIASIPFEFNVGNKSMPAGEYMVSQVNPSSDLAVLQLSSRNGEATVLVQMNPVIARDRQQAASLKFNRYGNHYFFAQAWMPGNDGLAANKSGAERGVQKEMASIKARTETVALRRR